MSLPLAAAPGRRGLPATHLSSPTADFAWRAALVVGFALVLCLRMPQIALHGRFWAEEGHEFFHNAWIMPWQQALFAPVGGYLNIVANAAGLLAHHLVPLEEAPHVTFAVALLFQCLPAVLLVSSRAEWLRPPLVLVAALLLVATPVVGAEVWLNTIHSQFHLALCAALILALETRGGAVGAFRLALLVLAPLSGPGSVFLLPLFGLRALLDRSGQRLLQAAALGFGTALQLALFYAPTLGRSYGIGVPMLIGVFFVKHVAIPLLGSHSALHASAGMQAAFLAGHLPWLRLALTLGLFSLFALGVAWRREPAPIWLFAGALAVAVLSYYGAIAGRENLLRAGHGLRYAFVPQILFGLSLLALAATKGDWSGRLAAVFVAWIIAVGVYSYTTPVDPIFSEGPSWPAEVAQWREDPAHPLAIWPPGWSVTLPPPPSR